VEDLSLSFSPHDGTVCHSVCSWDQAARKHLEHFCRSQRIHGGCSFVMHHRKRASIDLESQCVKLRCWWGESLRLFDFVPPARFCIAIQHAETLDRRRLAFCGITKEPPPWIHPVRQKCSTRFQELSRQEMSPVIKVKRKSYCTSVMCSSRHWQSDGRDQFWVLS